MTTVLAVRHADVDLPPTGPDPPLNAAGRRRAEALARVVGRAHARQMDLATRVEWMSDLQRNRTRTLDAPSWLWSSVVQLVGAHEMGYLAHCRAYALEHAQD